MRDAVNRIVQTTLELKTGERVRFQGGSVYVKAEDGSLRRGSQKLNKKQRRAQRQARRQELVQL